MYVFVNVFVNGVITIVNSLNKYVRPKLQPLFNGELNFFERYHEDMRAPLLLLLAASAYRLYGLVTVLLQVFILYEGSQMGIHGYMTDVISLIAFWKFWFLFLHAGRRLFSGGCRQRVESSPAASLLHRAPPAGT